MNKKPKIPQAVIDADFDKSNEDPLGAVKGILIATVLGPIGWFFIYLIYVAVF